jgi:nucleotide-binding universal stress UspA family protein
MTAIPAIGISIKNILVPVDFSTPSHIGLRVAATIAKIYGANLWIVHVLNPADPAPFVAPETLPVLTRSEREYGQKMLTEIDDSAFLCGVKHQVLLEQGAVAPQVAKAAEEHDVDLIVMGAQGASGIPKALFGSTAEEIFRTAICPVMTIGPEVKLEALDEIALRVVLYPTDFGPESAKAFEYAVSLAREVKATLVVLNVEAGHNEDSPSTQNILRREIEHRIGKLFPCDPAIFCQPIIDVQFGDPADVIVQAASSYKADLVVMGVKHAHEFATHLLGSVVPTVVHNAPCPVLTVMRKPRNLIQY